MNRIGIVGIVIEDLSSAPSVNSILHQYNHLIIGRMGLPYKARGISIISIMVDGTNEEIGSLSGKLGQLKGVTAKTALTKKSYEKERYK
jgi:putative iron-only hydrogenase system regulator